MVISSAFTGAPFLFSLANHFGNNPSFATMKGNSPASNVHPNHAPSTEIIKPIFTSVDPQPPTIVASTCAILGESNCEI